MIESTSVLILNKDKYAAMLNGILYFSGSLEVPVDLNCKFEHFPDTLDRIPKASRWQYKYYIDGGHEWPRRTMVNLLLPSSEGTEPIA